MKPGGQYRKGANKERWLVKECLRNGAVLAFRSAGSHSPIDVVAVYKTGILLFQCKAGKCPAKDEMLPIEELRKSLPWAEVMLLWFPDRGKPVIIEKEAK